MNECKYIPLSELKVGMKIEGYKNGKSTCITSDTITGIDGNIVYTKRDNPIDDASNYLFSIKMTDEEVEQKYEKEIQEIKEALNHKLGQVDGCHEMWNTWLYAGDLADIASELNQNDLRIIGYATLTSPKYCCGEVYDIGVVAEFKNGEHIWCHTTDKHRKNLICNFDPELMED